jgi:hypothetical protein
MKLIFALSMLFFLSCNVKAKAPVYYGSTPPDMAVREFLNISLTDSIDFIKWKLELSANNYKLSCRYGIGRPNTNGFTNEKEVNFSGKLSKDERYYHLRRKAKTLQILELNSNLLHLLDKNKRMLVGNGGYSYTLNIDSPVKSTEFGFPARQTDLESVIAFEGRTPCQELSTLLRLNKRDVCDKLKWYIIFFSDSVTGQPSHYLKDGTAYRQETMVKGKWEIVKGANGKIIYKLDPEKQSAATHLLRADDNILLFTDPEGNLLVGNEDFSYTLNRTKVKKR